MELDELDRLAAEAFPGSIVRKDLALRFKGQYPVPTYVGEFLLGRYCATIDEQEIAEGLLIVQQQLQNRTVRAGEHELFKSRAREQGSVKIIDLLTARLDASTDSYLATLPSLQLKDVRIADSLVRENERMLTGGFYAEIELVYYSALESDGRPFSIGSLRPIQLSKRDILDSVARGRRQLSTSQWRNLLLRSVGFEPEKFTRRAQDLLILRMVPFVERNYNMVEVGPRGTGKSHLFQQISPYSHLVSGGKATVAKMFVNMASGQRGLVAQYDVVCFDEVAGIDFDQKDGVNIMKGYMESGEFSRGKESIRADGGIVMVGNFDVDVAQQLRLGHLFGPFPKEMRNDTAFMDRVHSYIPGWDLPKLEPVLFSDHFGLVSDYIAETWTRLRDQSRLSALEGRLQLGPALSGRDRSAVNHTVSGLLKLLYPDPSMPIPDEDIEWATRLAEEVRLRVKEQQKRIARDEFERTDFSFRVDDRATEPVATQEQTLPAGAGVSTAVPPEPAAVTPKIDPEPVTEDGLRDLIAKGETPTVEFKPTLRWDISKDVDNPEMQRIVTRAIASLLNADGGKVLIGVRDDRSVYGVDADIAALDHLGQGGQDGFRQALANVMAAYLGGGVTPLVKVDFVPLDGHLVCVVSVKRSPVPVYHTESRDRQDFYVRIGTITKSLSLPEANSYIRSQWG